MAGWTHLAPNNHILRSLNAQSHIFRSYQEIKGTFRLPRSRKEATALPRSIVKTSKPTYHRGKATVPLRDQAPDAVGHGQDTKRKRCRDDKTPKPTAGSVLTPEGPHKDTAGAMRGVREGSQQGVCHLGSTEGVVGHVKGAGGPYKRGRGAI